MANWIVSRHPGAVEWLLREGVKPNRLVTHLQKGDIKTGDTVIGTLPIPMVADICNLGARYLHMSFDMPRELRGQELTAKQLTQLGCKLVEYRAQKLG